MGFNKTQVRDKLRSILNQIYTLNDNGSIQLENYSDFTEALENLWQVSSSLYERDEEGKYKSLDSDNYIQLMTAYGEALDKSAKLQADPQQSPELNQLTETLTEILNQDMSALKNIVPGKNVTLPEVAEKGRSVTIDLGSAKLVGSGNALSNRIPVEYSLPSGETRKGFFTQKTTVVGKAECMEALKPVKEKYPDFSFVLDRMQAMNEKDLFIETPWTTLTTIPFGPKADAMDAREGRELGLMYCFGDMEFSNEERETLLSQPGFWQFYEDLRSTVSQYATGYMTYTSTDGWLGGKLGERIDNRNSAMSMVGKLMGRPELLAPAEPMTIIVDGKEIEGTFMENAVGKEVFGLKEDDPMVTYTEKNYDNPQVFSDIADLQVIDYISGNIDRHEGNFFMQFEGEGENARLTKLTGIDNDLSFGVDMKGYRIGNKFVRPEEMGIIDQDTAVRVMALTENTLKLSLKGFGLNDAQLESAWKRTTELQEQINKSLDHYKDVPEGKLDENFPRIVSKENMGNYNLESISFTAYKSQFHTFSNLDRLIKNSLDGKKIEKRLREQVSSKVNLEPEPEKPKAVRLTGKITKNSMFVQPDKEAAMQQPTGKVDIEIAENSTLTEAGGQLSSRKAVSYTDKNGVEKKGFFTARTELNFEKSCKQTVKNLSVQYPRFQDFLATAEPYLLKGLSTGKMQREGLPGYSPADMKVLNTDPDFSAMMKTFTKEIASARMQKDNYVKGMGAGADSTVDLRNVAMSGIAKVMGNSSLLAESKPMRLKQGDRIVEGVFMDMAKGKDYRSVTADDPMTDYTEEVYNCGVGLKSLSDLQVLDYICMNPDRHHQNMMYQFENVNGKVKFVGVQGIDNDLSFGSVRHKADEEVQNAGALKDIKCISKEQADFIRNYDPAQIEEAVKGCRLSAQETTAIIDRIETLKARMKDGQIEVLDDAAWEKKTLSELSSGNNIFTRVKDNLIGPKMKRWAEVNIPQPDKKELEFAKGVETGFTEELVRESEKKIDEKLKADLEERNNGELSPAEKIIKDRSELDADVRREAEENRRTVNPFEGDAFAELKNQLTTLDVLCKQSDHFFGGSKEYTNLKNGYDELKQIFSGIEEKNRSKTEEVELIETVKEQLQYIDLAADAMMKKTEGSKSSNQLDRREFAIALRDFSKTTQKQLSDYNRAALEDQKSVRADYFKEKYKPVEEFIESAYPSGRELNPRNEDQLLDYNIKVGLKSLHHQLVEQLDRSKDTYRDLAASVLLKNSFAEAENSGEVNVYDDMKGKVRNVLKAYEKDSFVDDLAEKIAKNPEDFMEQYMKDGGAAYYESFRTHANEVLQNHVNEKREPAIAVNQQKGEVHADIKKDKEFEVVEKSSSGFVKGF